MFESIIIALTFKEQVKNLCHNLFCVVAGIVCRQLSNIGPMERMC